MDSDLMFSECYRPLSESVHHSEEVHFVENRGLFYTFNIFANVVLLKA